MTNPVQDTISFALVAEETVINTTVKLTATISCIVTPDMTEAKLKEGIRAMMKMFISETQGADGKKSAVTWQFANLNRTTHASGMEQADLTATARVHESDNYSLEMRARAVSQEGMTITNVAADTTPPQHMIEAAESELRIKLLKKAQTELTKINEATAPLTYRLGNINYQMVADSAHFSMANATRSMNKTATAMAYGSTFGEEEDSLGNAVKLTLRASVELRHHAA